MTLDLCPAVDPVELRAWLSANLSPIAARVALNQLSRHRLMLDDASAKAFPQDWLRRVDEPAIVEQIELPRFGDTQPRLAIFGRNDVSWIAARAWCANRKKADIAALKAAKACVDPRLVEQAADELAGVLVKIWGRGGPALVSTVPVGHSCRPDSFAVQLAAGVAQRLDLSFAKLFADRFVSGSSHPKEFRKLPPVEMVERPEQRQIYLIDDVSTSGWHLEESMTALRASGYAVQSAVWIGGVVT